MKKISVLSCAAILAAMLISNPSSACNNEGCGQENQCQRTCGTPSCCSDQCEQCTESCENIPEQIELSASCSRKGITKSCSVTIPKYEEYIITGIETDADGFIVKSDNGESYDSTLIQKANEFKLMSGTYTVEPILKKGQKKASVRITLERWHGARG